MDILTGKTASHWNSMHIVTLFDRVKPSLITHRYSHTCIHVHGFQFCKTFKIVNLQTFLPLKHLFQSNSCIQLSYTWYLRWKHYKSVHIIFLHLKNPRIFQNTGCRVDWKGWRMLKHKKVPLLQVRPHILKKKTKKKKHTTLW